eukprot:8956228-Lingulodinium_polyedra.AAC.1
MQLGGRQGLHEAGLAPTTLTGRVRTAVQWPQRDAGCSSHDLQIEAFPGLHEGRPCLVAQTGRERPA